MEFTKEDKDKLAEVIKRDYNIEQLKDFIAKCIGESALMVFSLNSKDGKDKQRRLNDSLGYTTEIKRLGG